jgi:hypothetical protein
MSEEDIELMIRIEILKDDLKEAKEKWDDMNIVLSSP